MECTKNIFLKYQDTDKLAEEIKDIMRNDDMSLKSENGNQYSFDRYGDYTRTVAVGDAALGWLVVSDDDYDNTDDLCSTLSDRLPCFALCMGICKNVLAYSLFENGVLKDQYMSSFKYYEYEVDDEVENMYSGSAEAFSSVLNDENVGKLKQVLDDCKGGKISARDAAFLIQQILGIIELEKVKDEDIDGILKGEEDQGYQIQEDDDISDIFYVDFNSINIRTENQADVINAVVEICRDMGYEKTEDFSETSQKKGFFSKIKSSVKEEKRVEFFISPSSNGWITLVGELEKLYGGEPSDWEFMHIEDKLSEMLNAEVIVIYADSEKWGFDVIKSGNKTYSYSSTDEKVYVEDINEIIPDIEEETIKSIFDLESFTAREIDAALEKFCGLLGIGNYKINIPMDYSDEEFYKRVINPLPDGSRFTNIKFRQKQ